MVKCQSSPVSSRDARSEDDNNINVVQKGCLWPRLARQRVTSANLKGGWMRQLHASSPHMTPPALSRHKTSMEY
jgi:hypothetical protein